MSIIGRSYEEAIEFLKLADFCLFESANTNVSPPTSAVHFHVT